MIIDIGKSTYSVAIVKIEDQIFEVASTHFDTSLGGNNFTDAIVEHYVKLINKKHSFDVNSDPLALAKLRQNLEEAKHDLGRGIKAAEILVENLYEGFHFTSSLTDMKFTNLTADLIQKFISPLDKVLEDYDLKKSDIKEYLLIGGSTKLP